MTRRRGMTKPRRVRHSAPRWATGIVVAALIAAGGDFAAAAGDDGSPPNLVVLLTDDQRHDHLGVCGHPVLRTPHLDALAGGGVRFSNAYVVDSICSVSRACILSGQYPAGHGVHVLDTTPPAEVMRRTYPALLREAGYRVGHVGKWHLGPTGDGYPELFDDWRAFEGFAVHYATTDDEGRPIHLTRKLGDQAVDLLGEYARDDRPFCLNLWFQAPHDERYHPDHRDAADSFDPDPAFDNLYADWTPPKPETFDEFERAIPGVLRPHLELRRRWRRRFEEEAVRVRLLRNYCRLITGVDEVVGRVREALRRHGLAENTVVVFLSDNGWFHGEHGLSGKFWPHEPSARVPMIWFDPRLPAERRGVVENRIALNVDVAPTLLDLAGLDVPPAMQGRSLRPLLTGEDVEMWRRDFFYQHLYQASRELPDGSRVPVIPACEAVVGGRLKYIRFLRAEDSREIPGERPLYEMLFDLEADPLERLNLAGDARRFDDLKRLRARCDALELQASSPHGEQR